jgi:hypothetical protein
MRELAPIAPGFGRREGASRRVGLVGCVSQKAKERRAAEELYLSALFRGRRCFVKWNCSEWWILSAKHGLVGPREPVDPYDVTLKNASRQERTEWSARVLEEIKVQIRPRQGDVFEIHAGNDYRGFGLVDGLRRLGCVVEVPAEGMSIGHQLRFYKSARSSD